MAKDYTALKKQFLESSRDFEEKLLLAKSSIIRSTIYITDTQDKLTDEATLDTIRNQIITNKKIANINISLDSISLVVSRYSQKVDTIEDVYAREYLNNFSKSGQLKRWASNGATLVTDNIKGYALKLTTAGRMEAYSDMFEVSPTNTFKVSFSLNNPNINNSGTVSFKIYAYDKNKSLVSCKAITSSNITDATDIELFATKNTTNNTYQTFSGYIYGCNTEVDVNVPKGEMLRAMKLSDNVRYLSIRLILNCVEPYGDGNNHTVYIADPFIGDIDNSVVSINKKLTEAFIKLEPDKIMQVVSNNVYTKEEVNTKVTGVENKLDNLNIGTENYILRTDFTSLEDTYTSDGTITVNDGTITVKNATVLKMDLAKSFSTIKASGDITMSAIATQTSTSNVGLNKFIGGNIDVYSENHPYIVESIKKLKINMITIPIAVSIPNATSSSPIVEDWALNRTKAYLANLNSANLITKDTCLIFEPHPLIGGGSISETEFNPSNKTEFFKAWKTLIVDCLKALSEYSFYGIYIGTNFEKFDSSEEDLVYWDTLCRDIKALYNNHKLIYRINYWTTASWAQDLKDKYLAKLNNPLWSKVDIISIASYFELNEKKVPTTDELYNDITKGTSIYGRGQNIYQEVKNFYDKWKKPVMFGELGCPSKEYGAMNPWSNLTQNVDNQEVQKNYFEAYNRAFIYENTEFDNSWFLGYSVFTVGTPTTEYDIVNKQAQSSVNKGLEFITNTNSLHMRCQINDKTTNKTIVDFNLPLSQMMNSVQSVTTKLQYDATSKSQIIFNLKSNATFTMSKPILTDGTKASSWTRSSEDIQADINNVQNNLDNLNIGVTNLLVNSNFKKGLSYYTIASPNQPGTIEVVEFQGRKCVKFTNVGYWDVSKYFRTPNFAVKQGDKVTFSADFYFTAGAYVAVDYAGVLDRGDNHITVPTLNKWYRLSATSTVGATSDGSGSLSLYAWGREHKISGYITLLKVEVGEKATAWSEAIEDIQDQFQETNKTVETYKSQVSELSTSVGKISAKVETSEQKITGVEKFTILREVNNFSSSGVLDRWSKSGSGEIELVNNQSFPYALAVTTNNNAMVATDYIDIDNTKNYKFTLDIKTTLADTGVPTAFSYYFGILCYNANKEVIPVKKSTPTGFNDDTNPYFVSWGKNPHNTHDWKTYNAYLYGSSYNMAENDFNSTYKGNCDWTFVLPKGAKYIRVRFLHYRQAPTYGDNSTGTAFFANPTMMEIDDRFINTEKRLKTAEEQITEDAIIQTVKDAQTEDGKNVFVLGSIFEQTVNAFNFKFTQTGVLNEVENSNFASVFRRWTLENPNNVRTFIEHSLNYGGGDIMGTFSVYCEECLGDNTVLYKQLVTPKNPLMTTFTLSACYHYEDVRPSNGTSYPMAYVYLEFWNEDGTVEYYNQAELLDKGRTTVAWETIHNTYTREKKPIKEIYVAVYKRNTTGKMRITQIDLHEGSIHRKWIPNANETVNNSTSIDTDGITVKMDEGEGKQGYSKINYEGISVHNANGEVKAWFGQNNTARIDDLEVRGRVSNPYIIQKNTGRPYEFYVSPQQTGNGSGADPNNRANSVNKVLEFVWNNYGCYSWRQDLTIHIAGGSYYEDIYVGGWLGSGVIKLLFDSNAVLYGTIVVEENTPFVELRGGRYGWDGNNGCIIYPTDTAITIRSSNCIVDGFRSRPSHYPNYGGTFVKATHGSRVLIASCDVVKYWHFAWADLLAFIHLADNRGDVQQLAGDAFNATYYLLGTNRPLCNSGVNFINCWNTNIVEKNGAVFNSVWIPKDTTPPPPVESWQWFEQSFALTNLRSIPEGSGSGTSARYGEMGQGKWGGYKAHRGWADIPQALRDFCSGARNISIYLSLTRLNTNHGNAGATPVPKLIQTDGSVYSVGTGFARGDRHEVGIGGNLTNAFATGAKNSVEMFSTSSSDYSFYNNVVLRVRCEKRV